MDIMVKGLDFIISAMENHWKAVGQERKIFSPLPKMTPANYN